MPPYEFDPNAPIYLQIIGEIKKRSVRGVYSPGSKLPSVRDMAKEMGVNPNTMARAYAELEREGFVFTRRGQGSFVTEDGKKIEDEKRALAHSAAARFVVEVGELDLSSEQIADLLRKIEEDLT
ncbi:MAG: GntR family transcriptional regulator [Gemmatimonadetes bacterium]|nr:GntR family transcriptional regulator [Gemmatimonadota bacterium]MYF71850.1 GntR family transcriptional regulator [Gemmatimonadota bacterium]